MNRRFHLLVNPTSGAGRAPEAARPVARLLREAGAEVTVDHSTGPVACAQMARTSAARGDVVVAVGGDGMLSSIAEALVVAQGVLGIVPSGRGNDFARMLGLSGAVEDCARTLLEGTPREVDIIDAGRRVVLGSVYAGVDSLGSELVERTRRLPTAMQYPYAAVRALLSFTPTEFTVDIDGQISHEQAYTVVVANSGYYGSGMHIAPAAVLDDGLLDVVIVRAASKLRLIRSMPRVYDGTHVDMDSVVVHRGREVRLSSRRPVTAYGDGERLAPLPTTVSVRPRTLKVLTR